MPEGNFGSSQRQRGGQVPARTLRREVTATRLQGREKGAQKQMAACTSVLGLCTSTGPEGGRPSAQCWWPDVRSSRQWPGMASHANYLGWRLMEVAPKKAVREGARYCIGSGKDQAPHSHGKKSHAPTPKQKRAGPLDFHMSRLVGLRHVCDVTSSACVDKSRLRRR